MVFIELHARRLVAFILYYQRVKLFCQQVRKLSPKVFKFSAKRWTSSTKSALKIPLNTFNAEGESFSKSRFILKLDSCKN